MATSSWSNAAIFQATAPHTFNALQHLVMAMADFASARGKRTLFGRDKGLAAYKRFEEKLRDTLLAMVLDGVIVRNVAPGQAREKLIEAIQLFAATFPNWRDAYAFADEYLVRSRAVAEDRIQSAMRWLRCRPTGVDMARANRTRAGFSRGFAGLGVLLLVLASVSPSDWYPPAQLFVGIAFLAASHAPTPCQDQITRWWQSRVLTEKASP
jgi:hypothetical protein